MELRDKLLGSSVVKANNKSSLLDPHCWGLSRIKMSRKFTYKAKNINNLLQRYVPNNKISLAEYHKDSTVP